MNVSIDSYRARQRRPIESTVDAVEDLYRHQRLDVLDPAGTGRSAEDELLARTSEELTWEVDRLPADYRLTVQLADLKGLSYKEISERLDIPVGTVMSRLHRGRRVLRRRLQPRDLE